MNTCQYCQQELPEGAYVCPHCGTPVYAAPAPHEITEAELPAKYRPLGAWAYFGYTMLFSIPMVGFILLIVFSCNSSNINRRNFARSYWCGLILVAIVAVIVAVIAAATGIAVGGATDVLSAYNY